MAGIRRARISAACALVLTCACIPAMARQQSSTDSATPKKSAPAKTSTTAHHHTSTASSASNGARKSAGTTHTASVGKRSSRKKKLRGQQKIDSERAQEIQAALIREHYLTGEATGTWNQTSEDAMRRYQADHGWQSKQVPDSRALIKLGLGPSKDHLLNPESAMITGPDAPTSQSPAPVSSAPSPGPAATNAPNRQ